MVYTDGTHLVADSLQELHEFAAKIGRKRCWYEGMKYGHPHYDLHGKNHPMYEIDHYWAKRVIEYGAVAISPFKIPEISNNCYKLSKTKNNKI